jgi:hypothetical protein
MVTKTAIKDIRGVMNELSDAAYIVRYDNLVIQNGVVSEIKLVNNQVDSLKFDSNGDGIPDTIIPPSRTITNPQTEDLQSPQAALSWGKRRSFARRVTVNATDNSSGVKRIYYKSNNWTGFQSINGSLATFSVSGLSSKTIQVIAEDNAGNRSNVLTYNIPKISAQ